MQFRMRLFQSYEFRYCSINLNKSSFSLIIASMILANWVLAQISSLFIRKKIKFLIDRFSTNSNILSFLIFTKFNCQTFNHFSTFWLTESLHKSWYFVFISIFLAWSNEVDRFFRARNCSHEWAFTSVAVGSGFGQNL